MTDSSGAPDLEWYGKAAAIYEVVVGENPADLDARQNAAFAHLELADALAACGQVARSEEFKQKAAAITKGFPIVSHACAQMYGMFAREILKAPVKLDAASRSRLQERYAGHVMPLLRQAVDDGFKGSEQIRNDPAFAPLHADPQFLLILSDAAFPSSPFFRQ